MQSATERSADERVRRVGSFRRWLNRPELAAVAGAILVFAFFAITAGDSGFLTFGGTMSYLEVAAQLGIVAVPVALLMIAGEFDLSVGSMIGAAGMVVAISTAEYSLPLWAAVLLAFGMAALIGLFVHRHAGNAVRIARPHDRLRSPDHRPHAGGGPR
jgi:simple sugar transport system permease protein